MRSYEMRKRTTTSFRNDLQKFQSFSACIDRRGSWTHKKKTAAPSPIYIEISLDYAICTPRVFVYLHWIRRNAIEKEEIECVSFRWIAQINEWMEAIFRFHFLGFAMGAQHVPFIGPQWRNLHEIQMFFLVSACSCLGCTLYTIGAHMRSIKMWNWTKQECQCLHFERMPCMKGRKYATCALSIIFVGKTHWFQINDHSRYHRVIVWFS